ncbi:MAG: hypothetical protein K6B14_06120 [Lachnospiraceae bacterium]|nr:hypothetical protein [Lachnospiraceae bacterium]
MDLSMDNQKKTPSRRECEEAIHRILITEILQNGKNDRFKGAVDFMKYFESLYPAGQALTKQVQRAVKAMDMPRDKDGYFIADKTHAQADQDRELTRVMNRTDAEITDMGTAEMVFLSCDESYLDYLYQLIGESDTLSGKYITMLRTNNGIIFFTDNRNSLESVLNNLING